MNDGLVPEEEVALEVPLEIPDDAAYVVECKECAGLGIFLSKYIADDEKPRKSKRCGRCDGKGIRIVRRFHAPEDLKEGS